MLNRAVVRVADSADEGFASAVVRDRQLDAFSRFAGGLGLPVLRSGFSGLSAPAFPGVSCGRGAARLRAKLLQQDGRCAVCPVERHGEVKRRGAVIGGCVEVGSALREPVHQRRARASGPYRQQREMQRREAACRAGVDVCGTEVRECRIEQRIDDRQVDAGLARQFRVQDGQVEGGDAAGLSPSVRIGPERQQVLDRDRRSRR